MKGGAPLPRRFTLKLALCIALTLKRAEISPMNWGER